MVFKVPSNQSHSMTLCFCNTPRRSCLYVHHKGIYFNFSIIFCFILIVMSALGTKSVIFGEYGTQSWGEERTVYSNTQQTISSSLTKVMLMPSYLLEITEGLLSTWAQWCLSVSAEHQSAALHQCITIQIREPKSSVRLHSPKVSLDPWSALHLSFFTHLGLTLTTAGDRRWISWVCFFCQLTPLYLNFSPANTKIVMLNFLFPSFIPSPLHNWCTGAEEDLQFYYCCISLLQTQLQQFWCW